MTKGECESINRMTETLEQFRKQRDSCRKGLWPDLSAFLWTTRSCHALPLCDREEAEL